MRTPHQTFEYREIDRALIREAPYNPRSIQPENRKELAKGLKRYGLVNALVWNEQTGNLVSGHQRLALIDATERKAGTETFTVGVAVVNLPPKSEKALNVFLNNHTAQGEFDQERFLQFLGDASTPSLEEMGLDELAVVSMFGPLPQLDVLLGKPPKEPVSHPEQRKPKSKPDTPEKERTYFIIVFPSYKEREAYVKHNGFPEETTHITADEFRQLLKPERE